MKEMFNKNKFDLIKYSPMKPGTKSIMSEERKKSSQGGVYGVFKKEEDMIFKVKDNSNIRNKGARCDQSSIGNATIVLKEIFSAADIAATIASGSLPRTITE